MERAVLEQATLASSSPTNAPATNSSEFALCGCAGKGRIGCWNRRIIHPYKSTLPQGQVGVNLHDPLPLGLEGKAGSRNRKLHGAAVSGCFLPRMRFTSPALQDDRIMPGRPRLGPTSQKESARSLRRTASGGNMTFSWTEPYGLRADVCSATPPSRSGAPATVKDQQCKAKGQETQWLWDQDPRLEAAVLAGERDKVGAGHGPPASAAGWIDVGQFPTRPIVPVAGGRTHHG